MIYSEKLLATKVGSQLMVGVNSQKMMDHHNTQRKIVKLRKR